MGIAKIDPPLRPVAGELPDDESAGLNIHIVVADRGLGRFIPSVNLVEYDFGGILRPFLADDKNPAAALEHKAVSERDGEVGGESGK